MQAGLNSVTVGRRQKPVFNVFQYITIHKITTQEFKIMFMDCLLCGTRVLHKPVTNEERTFCCTGCYTVFQVLEVQGVIGSFRDHPIFDQAVKSGLISNPFLLEEIQKKTANLENIEYERLHLEIDGMWCPSCAEVIRLVLLSESGIRLCVVDYTTDLASIEYAPRYIPMDQIFILIQRLGYRAHLLESPEKKRVSFSLHLRLAIAAFCSMNIMMFSYPVYASYFSQDEGVASSFAWISCLLSLPSISYCLWPIAKRCFRALSYGIVGMELLVMMAVIAAFGLSFYHLTQGGLHIYFDSMSVIVAFVLLGKMIESKAKFKAKDSLFRISKSLPKRGRKKNPDGSHTFVSLKEVRKGDLILIFCGEKVVIDGKVIEGSGMIEEAAMTGESIPIKKEMGDSVLAGSILIQGWISIQVTAEAGETALHKIIEMVEQDLHQKTPYVRSADQIVRWFVPLVILIALSTAFFCWMAGIEDLGRSVMETAFIRAVTILLIACPCAIGIAAPLAESQLISELASLGAIIKNRGCLRLLGRETAFVFDKTGTITEGKFCIASLPKPIDSKMLCLLKGVASYSNHPISVAIFRSFDVQPLFPDSVKEHTGLGIEASFQGITYWFGSPKFLQLQGIQTPKDEKENTLHSIVYFANEEGFLFPIFLGDSLRSNAPEVVQSCRPAKTYLISGDGQNPVKAAAVSCGFDRFLWEQSPLQKREQIEILKQKGHIVGMVGDGINDAPALSKAQVSISVVNATDISVQVSDILLTSDQLSCIPKIRQLARKGQRILKQNLFWAFGYNGIGIGLAVFGYLSPIFSAVAMVLSSIIVITNSRRIS